MAEAQARDESGTGRESLYIVCGAQEIHVSAWGAPDAPVVMLWHGLARTGRDFDWVARSLATRFRVYCPDQIGRGLSQWSDDPSRDYRLARYVEIAEQLADALGVACFSWLGTSMGGATSMLAAATRLKGRISRLLINDIGPELPKPAVERIKAYAASPAPFERMSDFEAAIRRIYRPFGRHTDAQWRHLAETSVRRQPNGSFTAHYDPRIVAQFDAAPPDYELWSAYDSLTLPTLVLRGAESDLLLPAIASEMKRRGPRPQMIDIEGCGHAPGLNVETQINIVLRFMTAG